MKDVIEKAKYYKRKVAGGFISINQDDIASRIWGDEVYVTTKIDGEFNILHFDGEKSWLINGNGRIKDDLGFLKTTSNTLKEKQIKSLTVAGELHLPGDGKRTRVFEVMSAIASNNKGLSLAAFDILDIDGEDFKSTNYANTVSKLQELFDADPAVTPVPLSIVASTEVNSMFETLVLQNNAEGLVVKTGDINVTYKLKPLYTVDAAVIGWTAGQENKVRTLLVALQKEDGSFVEIGVLGTGFNEDQKASLYDRLSKTVISSPYVQADKAHVAFQMVKPTLVVELAVNELLAQNTKGSIKNYHLTFDEEKGYEFVKSSDGVSLIHPVFKRVREDKEINPHDIRWTQVTDIVYIEEVAERGVELAESELIFREVYAKSVKGQTNVQKFMAWKTNKEGQDSYPAYVMNYTNFSPTRSDALKKDVRVSSSEEQILELIQGFIEKNIKKGWEKV